MADYADDVVTKLEKLGFRVNRYCSDGEVYMSRKRGSTTLMATVEPSGTVNGEPVDDFIAWVKRRK